MFDTAMHDLERTEAELLAWGILEPGTPMRWSRRFRGAVARAASELQHAEASGNAPPGHPVVVAVELALRQSFTELEVGANHRDFLAAVELASLPSEVLDLLGKGKSGA